MVIIDTTHKNDQGCYLSTSVTSTGMLESILLKAEQNKQSIWVEFKERDVKLKVMPQSIATNIQYLLKIGNQYITEINRTSDGTIQSITYTLEKTQGKIFTGTEVTALLDFKGQGRSLLSKIKPVKINVNTLKTQNFYYVLKSVKHSGEYAFSKNTGRKLLMLYYTNPKVKKFKTENAANKYLNKYPELKTFGFYPARIEGTYTYYE